MFDDCELPSRFCFPKSYVCALADVNCDEICPWWFVAKEPDKAKFFFQTINGFMQSPKTLVPFAKDDETGDIACFDGDDASGDPPVYFVTDEPSLSDVDWDVRFRVKNFEAWLQDARNERS